MSIICAAIKNGVAAVSCDTQTNFGGLKVSARHLASSSKLYSVNGSVLGIVGWTAISDIVEHMIATDRSIFKLNNKMEILSTLLKLHSEMKEVGRRWIRIGDNCGT